MEARWYSLNRNGLATLCANEADAKSEAARQDRAWPQGAPHRAVQLVEAAVVVEAVAAERERCAQLCDGETMIQHGEFGAGWVQGAKACADLIRGR